VTDTRTVKSSEIQVGDIVRAHGMRVRIDAIRVYSDNQPERQRVTPDMPVYACQGTVINLDEVLAAGFVPAGFMTTDKWVHGQGWVIDRRNAWTVQGNDLALWNVER